MPGRRSSRYSKQQNMEWEGEIASILFHSSKAMTIEEIRLTSPTLTNVSPQKIVKILSNLFNRGQIDKDKDPNKNNRMTYIWKK